LNEKLLIYKMVVEGNGGMKNILTENLEKIVNFEKYSFINGQ